MKIALIADTLTETSLKYEADIYLVTPLNYKMVFKFWKPDLFFVESAWQGHKNRWKYKIAEYPHHSNRTNKILSNAVSYAKKLNIPTLFWNKEDGVHYDRFINSAKLFDYIFTVDENTILRYKKDVDEHIYVDTLMFAVQPKIHKFTGFDFGQNAVNFVGSYSSVHQNRKRWQDMIFESVCESGLKLHIWDRNSKRKAKEYRYPKKECITVNPSVSYKDTATIYKKFLISLNINTVEDSPTMFSRRLMEILACGGIVVTNPTLAVEKYFKEYCYIVSNKQEANEVLKRLANGPSKEDLIRAKRAAEYIASEHTWEHRMKKIKTIIGI
jgi:spore maturation protein CgeB